MKPTLSSFKDLQTSKTRYEPIRLMVIAEWREALKLMEAAAWKTIETFARRSRLVESRPKCGSVRSPRTGTTLLKVANSCFWNSFKTILHLLRYIYVYIQVWNKYNSFQGSDWNQCLKEIRTFKFLRESVIFLEKYW